MSRKIMLVGNWKMNNIISRDKKLALEIMKKSKQHSDKIDIVFGPSFLSLPIICKICNSSNFIVAAQNCSWEKSGAYTGEVSPTMLKDVGCEYVILGHSERRDYLEETNALINTKIKIALEEGLKVILCVGELLKEKEGEKTKEVIMEQITNGVKNITSKEMENITIAYEPVWAIGTGKVATKEQAQEVHAFIRKLLTELHSKSVAQSTRILYGGSANPSNIADLVSQKDIDGGLIGGASLNANSFAEIISIVAKIV